MGRRYGRRAAGGCAQGRRGKLIAALRWHLEWGDRIDWLQDVAEESGKTPRALLTRPEIEEASLFAWQAFFDLAGDRHLGFGCLGRIPWTAIDAYAARFSLVGDEFERFHGLIVALDDEWLRIQAERASPRAWITACGNR